MSTILEALKKSEIGGKKDLPKKTASFSSTDPLIPGLLHEKSKNNIFPASILLVLFLMIVSFALGFWVSRLGLRKQPAAIPIVKNEIIEVEEPVKVVEIVESDVVKEPEPVNGWVIQLATFNKEVHARGLEKALEAEGKDVSYRQIGTFWVVYAGPYESMEESGNYLERYWKNHFDDAFIRYSEAKN